jgi:ABC-type phosphate/phosphonate transport system permease subunit
MSAASGGRESCKASSNRSSLPPPVLSLVAATAIIAISSWWLCTGWQLARIDLRRCSSLRRPFGSIVSDFIHIDLRPEVLDPVLKQMLVDDLQALIATTLGCIVAIPFVSRRAI